VVVAVVHAHRVDLFFVTLDAVGRADVITEDPGLVGGRVAREGVDGAASEKGGADVSEISVD
jgi:hypothetical protein